MSLSINVYAIQMDRIKNLVGSKDKAVISAITQEFKYFFSGVDDIDPKAGLTCAGALEQLINGDMSDDAPGYLYGYAFESLCAYAGEELSNICPIAHADAENWIRMIDVVLEKEAVAVRLSRLLFGGCPISIPEPYDFPYIGHWTPARLDQAKEVIQTADLSHQDSDIDKTLKQMKEWVEAGTKKADITIVGFLF